MGSFFGSVHLRTGDRDAVRRVVEQVAGERTCRFLVGPALNGRVAVYPEHFGQDERVAGWLAKEFPGDVLYVMVHDDDFFAYTFYQGGEPVDQYNSCPDYFGDVADEDDEDSAGAADGGRPEVFRHLLRDARALDGLRALLSPERAGRVTFASELLGTFADLLGLPNAATSYEYLEQGERHGIQGWDQFVRVPDQPSPKREW